MKYIYTLLGIILINSISFAQIEKAPKEININGKRYRIEQVDDGKFRVTQNGQTIYTFSQWDTGKVIVQDQIGGDNVMAEMINGNLVLRSQNSYSISSFNPGTNTITTNGNSGEISFSTTTYDMGMGNYNSSTTSSRMNSIDEMISKNNLYIGPKSTPTNTTTNTGIRTLPNVNNPSNGSSSLPNVNSNSQTSSGLPNVTNNRQSSDYGAYSNPKMVSVATMDEETAENMAAGAAAAALLVAQFGTGLGVNVGLDNGNPSYGIDIYFKGFSLGYQYSQFIDGEYTEYSYNGEPLYTDNNIVYLNAGTIGLSISKKTPSLMIKTSIGSWYDEEGLLDYEPNELYYKVGLQNSFGKKDRSGITGEIYMSSFGLGGAIGYIISFNRN